MDGYERTCEHHARFTSYPECGEPFCALCEVERLRAVAEAERKEGSGTDFESCDICGGAFTPGWWLRREDGANIHAEPHACIDALLERVAELEWALRPFAEAASLLPDEPDGASIGYTRYLTMQLPNNLRAAAAAIKEE